LVGKREKERKGRMFLSLERDLSGEEEDEFNNK